MKYRKILRVCRNCQIWIVVSGCLSLYSVAVLLPIIVQLLTTKAEIDHMLDKCK